MFCWLLALSSAALAQIPAPPANLNATRTGNVYQVTWTDKATNELSYQVDRSADAGLTVIGAAVLPANSNTFTDASIDPTKTYVYRVKALGDVGQSDFAYQGATTPLNVTCAQSLCYPESCMGFYPGQTYVKTIETACADCVLGISFTRFSTESYYDVLTVNDGNASNAPELGKYSGTTLPPTLISSGRSITFTFRPDPYLGSAGWQVSTQCIKRPGRPVITALHDIYSSQVSIDWEDNSADETGFKVEYSKSPAFANPVGVTLPANTTGYLINGLDSLTTYYFRVKAFNAQTESFLSNTYSATTTGKPFYELPLPISVSEARKDIRVADFTNDKLYDLFVFDFTGAKIYKNTGGNQFTVIQDIPGYITDAELADMDNDGDVDIVARTFDHVEVWVNTNGIFASAFDEFNPYIEGFTLGDYDGDGDVDVFGFNRTNPAAAWFRNNGNVEFALDSATNMTDVIYDAKTIDVDTDGHLDLLLSLSPTPQFLLNRNGKFSMASQYQWGAVPDMAITDVDNDGDVDAVLSFERGISVAENDGSSFKDRVVEKNAELIHSKKGLAGDFDNDGDIDVVFGADPNSPPGGGLATVCLNLGNHRFTHLNNFYFEGSSGSNLIAVLDWNNDGKLDVVMSDKTNGKINVWRNAMASPANKPSVPGQLAVTVTGNSARLSWSNSTDEKTPTLGIRYNYFVGKTTADEKVKSALSYRDSGQQKFAEVPLVPINHVDIAKLENGTYTWGVQAVDGAGLTSTFATGTFDVSTSLVIPAPKNLEAKTWSPFQNNLTWTDASAVEEGFVVFRSGRMETGYKVLATLPANSTHYEDTEARPYHAYYYRVMAYTKQTQSELSPIALVRSLSLFDLQQSTPTSATNLPDGEIAWIDLNEDGRRDFIRAGYVEDQGSTLAKKTYLKAYLQRADNPLLFDERALTIKEDPFLTTVLQYQSVSPGDMDNDGDIDLLLGRTSLLHNARTAEIVVLINDGDFSFTRVILDQFAYAYDVKVQWGDYDNDRDLDILSTVDNYRTEVFKNIGTQSFPLVVGYSGGRSAEWMDYNNDGLLDVAMTTYNSATSNFQFSLYANNGTDFVLRNQVFCKDDALAIADADNDGDEDVLIGGTDFLENDRVNDVFTIRDIGRAASPASTAWWIDYDNDNDADILADEFPYFQTVMYTNNNNLLFDNNVGAGGVGFNFDLQNTHISITDLDRDSDLDMFVYNQYGLYVYQNSNKVVKPIPATPTGLSTTIQGSVAKLMWQPVGKGNTYSVMVGSQPSSKNLLNPLSDETTGFRLPSQGGNARSAPLKIINGLPDGTYFWRVQTVDQSFQGSAFTREETFVVGKEILPKPVILSATGISSTRIKIVMPAMFSDLVKRYLYVSEDGINFRFMDTHTETEFVHEGLESNHTYYYRAIFFDSSHWSVYSDVVQATTLSEPEIKGANVPPASEDVPFAISLTDLVLINAPGYPEGYNLFIDKGDHYDVKNGVITPAANFNGTLSVPVKIASAVDTSNVFTAVVTVLPVNDAPSGFSLLLPQNNSIVESSVLMKWQPASDIDGDRIEYSVHVAAAGEDHIFETGAATELAFDIDDYPVLWNTEVLWYVTASDSQVEVNSPSFSFRYIVTGVGETTNPFEIYPNPVESSFVMRNLASTAGSTSVCDERGTVVQSAYISRHDQDLTVNVAALAPGIYFLRITTSDGVKNYKFVKR